MIPGTRSTHITQGDLQHAPTGSGIQQLRTWKDLATFPYNTQGAAAQQRQQEQQHQLEAIHKYKVAPPRFTGECNTFEEWKCKMTAYHGLQDPSYNRLLRQPEESQLLATNGQLDTAAPSQAVAEQFVQLSNNLHYILVNTCGGPASKICRQNSFETWRPLHLRYSIPLGTQSIGYLTNHSSMNRSSKRALQHGSFNSPSMNKTTTCSQDRNTAQ